MPSKLIMRWPQQVHFRISKPVITAWSTLFLDFLQERPVRSAKSIIKILLLITVSFQR